jgi:WD40 repeat protein
MDGEYDVRLYNVRTGEKLITFVSHTGPATTLAFSPDGKTLAFGSVDTTNLLWDLTIFDR